MIIVILIGGLAYFFQRFVPQFTEWICFFGYDVMFFACFSALTAAFDRKSWNSAFIVYLFGFLSIENIDFNVSSNGCSKYRILHEGDTIVIYNCHLQSNGLNGEHKNAYEQMLTNPKQQIRSKDTKELVKKLRDSAAKRATQTDLIIADIEKETSPYIIVCGDFNDSPISYTCRRMKEQLDDAYTSSGNGPGISYNRNKLYYRIDHILHSSKFKAFRCMVDRSIKASDHYPIYCFLKKE